jgi:hypothetical protein
MRLIDYGLVVRLLENADHDGRGEDDHEHRHGQGRPQDRPGHTRRVHGVHRVDEELGHDQAVRVT